MKYNVLNYQSGKSVGFITLSEKEHRVIMNGIGDVVHGMPKDPIFNSNKLPPIQLKKLNGHIGHVLLSPGSTWEELEEMNVIKREVVPDDWDGL